MTVLFHNFVCTWMFVSVVILDDRNYKFLYLLYILHPFYIKGLFCLRKFNLFKSNFCVYVSLCLEWRPPLRRRSTLIHWSWSGRKVDIYYYFHLLYTLYWQASVFWQYRPTVYHESIDHRVLMSETVFSLSTPFGTVIRPRQTSFKRLTLRYLILGFKPERPSLHQDDLTSPFVVSRLFVSFVLCILCR